MMLTMVCFIMNSTAQLICFDYPADTFPTPAFPNWVTAADFNDDGLDDLALCHYWGKKISIMMNDGNGNFPGVITYPINNLDYNMGRIIAADVNNDDTLDLILFGQFYDIHIFIGTGFGNFVQAPTVWTDIYWQVDGVSGFFDADSNLDLAVIDQGHEKLRIQLGDGTGDFNFVYLYPTLGSVPRRIVKGDFNEDGHDDLVICNMGTETHWYFNVVLYEGTGQGSFISRGILEDGYVPESIVIGDFNGDRHEDIIFNSYDRNLVKLWGNGDGTFQETETQDITTDYYSIYLYRVDINMDGFPDLAMGNDYFNMYVNDGNGNFEDTLFLNNGSNNFRVTQMAAGNFNADTKPDLVSAHFREVEDDYGTITVYLNCLPVGIGENSVTEEIFNLFPNPTQGQLEIFINPSVRHFEITRIFNSAGEEIDAGHLLISGHRLDLSPLNRGLYIIQFRAGDKTFAKKVLVY